MKTVNEVAQWCAGVASEFGDPADAVCQLFFRWSENQPIHRFQDLACGIRDGAFELWFDPRTSIVLPIVTGKCELDMLGSVAAFGAEQIAPGLWSLMPSLNVAGVIHGFVTLYDVPDPPPWESIQCLPAVDEQPLQTLWKPGDPT